MESSNTIRIPNPSKELMEFINKSKRQKNERMDKICEKYRRLINGHH